MRPAGMARAHLAFAVILVASACSSDMNPLKPTRPSPATAVLFSEDANPVIQSLTGHWEVVGGLGNLNKVSVNALKHLDGTVNGELEVELYNSNHELFAVAHATVLCLAIEGNTARLAAFGEERTTDGVVSQGYAFLTAIDNGEGNDAPPDRASALLSTTNEARALSHCDAPLIVDSRIFPLQRGNVQVRTSSPMLSTTPASFDEQSADAMQGVTGHYEFVGVNTGNDFKYSLSAIRHMDGSVSGEVEERTTFAATGDLVRDMHGTVTCFVISGNTAFIAGIVDRVLSNAPGQENLVPGAGFRLVVVDNGNGADDPPDLGSNARFGLPSSSDAFCAQPVPFNLEPIEHGNVVIRP